MKQNCKITYHVSVVFNKNFVVCPLFAPFWNFQQKKSPGNTAFTALPGKGSKLSRDFLSHSPFSAKVLVFLVFIGFFDIFQVLICVVRRLKILRISYGYSTCFCFISTYYIDDTIFNSPESFTLGNLSETIMVASTSYAFP